MGPKICSTSNPSVELWRQSEKIIRYRLGIMIACIFASSISARIRLGLKMIVMISCEEFLLLETACAVPATACTLRVPVLEFGVAYE